MTNNNNDPFGSPSQPPNGEFEFDIDVPDNVLAKAGAYKGQCVAVESSISQSGNPMLVWDFLIPSLNKTYRAWTSLSDNAKWKVLEFAAALKLPVDEKTKKLRFNRADAIGRPCIVILEHRKDNNDVLRDSIKRIAEPTAKIPLLDAGFSADGGDNEASDIPF